MSFKSKKPLLLNFSLIYMGWVLIGVPIWLHKKFGDELSIDSVLFHIYIGWEGVVGTDDLLLRSFFKEVLAYPLVLAAILILLLYKQKIIVQKSYEKASGIFLLVGVSVLMLRIDIAGYAYRSLTGVDVFGSIYVEPPKVTIVDVQKKNVIMIYVESLELSMRGENSWNENFLDPLDELAGWTSTGLTPAPGTLWTTAGMFSSQCAIPLKPFFRHAVKATREGFLPNLRCLGDVLKDAGYDNTFIAGTDVNFGGMNLFFGAHGYSNLKGKNELSQYKEHQNSHSWGGGLHDDELFSAALEEVKKRQGTNRPFMLSLITTDNHPVSGYPSPRCVINKTGDTLRDAIRCTPIQVKNFLDKLQRNGINQTNTVIVVMGDHPLMQGRDVGNKMQGERKVYFKILGKNNVQGRTKLTHFDVAPTVLDLLGMIDKNRPWGLGYSAFSDLPDAAYEKHFAKVVSLEISGPSGKYDSFFARQIVSGTDK